MSSVVGTDSTKYGFCRSIAAEKRCCDMEHVNRPALSSGASHEMVIRFTRGPSNVWCGSCHVLRKHTGFG